MGFGDDERTEEQKQVLVEKWIKKDMRDCNIFISLPSGRVIQSHSFVLYKYSKKYMDIAFPVTRRFSVSGLNEQSVYAVISWMYTQTIQPTDATVWNLMKVAYHFQVDKLEKLLLSYFKSSPQRTILGLNSASAECIQERPHGGFRPDFTSFQKESFSKELKDILKIFYDVEPNLDINGISNLNVTSIYALMLVHIDLKTKTRFIFLTIDWIAKTRPSMQTIHGIIQSLQAPITFKLNYDIRWRMYMFLTKFYSSSSEFYIWMDGTSDFMLAGPSEIRAIPPEVLCYPVQENPHFIVHDVHRDPTNVNAYRTEQKLGESYERGLICGLYEQRNRAQITYSYNQKGKHKTWGAFNPYWLRDLGASSMYHVEDPDEVNNRLEESEDARQQRLRTTLDASMKYFPRRSSSHPLKVQNFKQCGACKTKSHVCTLPKSVLKKLAEKEKRAAEESSDDSGQASTGSSSDGKPPDSGPPKDNSSGSSSNSEGKGKGPNIIYSDHCTTSNFGTQSI
ncbi:Protein CBG05370 [Caenorhabditis briggsae]|uniref:Protein CBG05370 n=1 Tax=Caenorhabditis briggsae TaxID=6238 RepID=A8WZQ0_CAEBR|nr:Protein CBG05370 [Caenorhabditis briggsae]CAP25860.1 Protein CBG05370 [Caenorhabditis briggsae]